MRNFSALGVLASICDPSGKSRAMVREQYPNVAIHERPEAALYDSEIDGAVIATPAEMHVFTLKSAERLGDGVLLRWRRG